MATPTEILTAGGLVNADLIVQAATATGVPLAIAAALIQKETGGRNVCGHDGSAETGPGVFSTKYGPVTIGDTTYAQGSDIPVTQANFAEFLRRVTAGEKNNGVGPAQITYSGYFKQAPDYPFWDALANIRFGLTILADYLDDDFSDASISSAAAHYNGGTNPGPRALAYGADLLTKTKIWRARLAGASELGGSMPKVFLSPSDQDNNPVDGGGNEQRYAQIRAAAAADVLRSVGIEVKISTAGVGDDSNGYIASINEGNAWGPDLYIADHSNAVAPGVTKRRGVYIYVWPKDDDARRLAQLVIDEVKPIFGDVPSGILDGSHLGEVNSTNATALLLELGYHDHPEDALIIRTRSVEIGQAEGRAIARFYGKTISQPSVQEDPMSTPEVVELLKQISSRTLTTADALTVGKEGVKFDGDVIARLRSIESKLDALATTTEPERAESEPETPAEPAPVTGATAIREALATARAALTIIESNL